MELDTFFIDWLTYCSELLCKWELSQIERFVKSGQKYKSTRFYKCLAKCEQMEVQTSPRGDNNSGVEVHIKKEFLNDVWLWHLPKDCKLVRVDFAINTDTIEKAMQYVTQITDDKEDLYFRSKTGETYYYGKREGTVYERVYYLVERGCWRYEVEIKPRAGRKNNVINKLHKDVVQIWNDFNCLMCNDGMNAREHKDRKLDYKRTVYIDIHLESEFVTPTKKFYNGLNRQEKKYFLGRLKHYEDRERAELWTKAITV